MRQVLIIGMGGIGKRHLRGFMKTGRTEISICEPSAAIREETASHHPIKAAHASLDAVDLAQFDLAVVAAPAHVHIPIAHRLADAGVPFLLEKPLATTMDGVDSLLDKVAATRLLVRVGYILRLRPWLSYARNCLAEGRIGNVRMVLFVSGQDFRKYRPDYQNTYYAKASMGGGAILDAASHQLDYALWTMGPVRQVCAMHDRLAFEGVECEDCVLMNLHFASGALGMIALNQFQKPNEASITFIGSEGNMSIDMISGIVSFAGDDSNKRGIENLRADDGLSALEFHESMFAIQANSFLDSMEGKPDSLATLEDAAANLRVALAAKESFTQQIIKTL